MKVSWEWSGKERQKQTYKNEFSRLKRIHSYEKNSQHFQNAMNNIVAYFRKLHKGRYTSVQFGLQFEL